MLGKTLTLKIKDLFTKLSDFSLKVIYQKSIHSQKKVGYTKFRNSLLMVL